MSERRLTPVEVADELKVSARLIQKLCASGQIQAAKIGSVWRISLSALDEYIDREAGLRPCRATSINQQTAPITLASKSTGATFADRYAQLIGASPASGSKTSSKKRRTSARA